MSTDRVERADKAVEERIKRHSFVCDLCNEVCQGFSNNARPLAKECCDDCNRAWVIPQRVQDIKYGSPLRNNTSTGGPDCPGAPKKPLRSCTRYSCVCPRNEDDSVNCNFYGPPTTNYVRIPMSPLSDVTKNHSDCIKEHYKGDVPRWESEWNIIEAKYPNYKFGWKCGFCEKPINLDE
jgi:hypothetical protein